MSQNQKGNEQTAQRLRAQDVLTADELSAIGCVAVQSAYLERNVEMLAGICIAPHETEDALRPVMSRLGAAAKVELLAELVIPRIPDEARKKRFQVLIAECKAALEERNTIIHGLWDSTPDSKVIEGADGSITVTMGLREATARRRTRKSTFTVDSRKVLDVARVLQGLQDAMDSFFDDDWENNPVK